MDDEEDVSDLKKALAQAHENITCGESTQHSLSQRAKKQKKKLPKPYKKGDDVVLLGTHH